MHASTSCHALCALITYNTKGMYRVYANKRNDLIRPDQINCCCSDFLIKKFGRVTEEIKEKK